MDVEKPEDGPSDNVRHTASGMETDNPSDVSGFKRLLDYMSSHNYGREDFAAYSQDPQWRLLMREEYPDYELPELSKESAEIIPNTLRIQYGESCMKRHFRMIQIRSQSTLRLMICRKNTIILMKRRSCGIWGLKTLT